MKKDNIIVDTETFLDGHIVKLRIDTFYNDFNGSSFAGDLPE